MTESLNGYIPEEATTKNAQQPDRIVLVSDSHNGLRLEETILIDELPTRRLNYGGVPNGSVNRGRSPVLPEGVDGLDLRGIDGNGTSHVIVRLEGYVDPITVPIYDKTGVGSARVNDEETLVVYAANAMQQARDETPRPSRYRAMTGAAGTTPVSPPLSRENLRFAQDALFNKK